MKNGEHGNEQTGAIFEFFQKLANGDYNKEVYKQMGLDKKQKEI